MEKVTYARERVFLQKSLENLLWHVFWCLVQEQGAGQKEEQNESERAAAVASAQTLIPQFAESAIEYNLSYAYPLISLFLCSLEQGQNILKSDAVAAFMAIEGPTSMAKAAYIAQHGAHTIPAFFQARGAGKSSPGGV